MKNLILILIFSPFISSINDPFPAKDVIELPVGRFPEPECRYSVHHGNRHGAIVRSRVDIGDEIYHFWNCDTGNLRARDNFLFCVMVNNCTVSDKENDGERQIQIIDENGCSIFPTILPDINYDGDLSAGIKVHAFALDVDTTAVHFTCNIRMLFKENEICNRPKCGKIRMKRNWKNLPKLD